MKITTIKITEETKKRILKLDLVKKDKSFDIIINELISFYEKDNKKYKEDYKNWQNQYNTYQKELENYQKNRMKNEERYEKEKEMWDRLLVWAKSKGFKG